MHNLKGEKKQMEKQKTFGKLRNFLWPIHNHELKKFLPLALIFFFISYNYSVLRNLKDIFILDNAGEFGAEVLYYIKTLGVTPAVIIYTLIYNSLGGKWGRHKMFFGVIAYFLVFFSIFAFILVPNMEILKLNTFADSAIAFAPAWTGLWEGVRYWMYSLFYIHAEMWGTFGLSILFWTFANEITNVKQSKRFYSFLALGPNIALLFSSGMLRIYNSKHTMMNLIYVVIASIALILVLYGWFTKNIYANPEAYDMGEKKVRKAKPKLSFIESMKFLFSSRYLRLIAILVFCYGAAISLIESVWKSQVKLLHISSGGGTEVLARIYSNEVFLIGITAITLVFASSFIINKSWKLGALITPVIAAVLSSIFFAFMIFGRDLEFFTSMFGVSSLMLAVIVGMIQVVLIKSVKYTLFDPTKESAYIPLDEESKLKGKAAVDGVGGRLGKSGGSALLTFFLIPFVGGGKISGTIPYLFFIIAVILMAWIYAVIQLDKEFKKLTAKDENQS